MGPRPIGHHGFVSGSYDIGYLCGLHRIKDGVYLVTVRCRKNVLDELQQCLLHHIAPYNCTILIFLSVIVSVPESVETKISSSTLLKVCSGLYNLTTPVEAATWCISPARFTLRLVAPDKEEILNTSSIPYTPPCEKRIRLFSHKSPVAGR